VAGTDVVEKGAPAGNTGQKRPRARLGIRIDMTPMVDVAFLLLIFFMVTTVFRQPLAMEINMPEPGAEVRVPESNVMTVYIDASDSLYYKPGTGEILPIGWDDLDATFRESAAANPNLIILVKIHRRARYNDMVEMMDTLEAAHMERFSLVPMEEEDVQGLEGPR
jgi:biopolymer transport protein ExbD